jgi:hypothetical protein
MATIPNMAEEMYLHSSLEGNPEFIDGRIVNRGIPTYSHGDGNSPSPTGSSKTGINGVSDRQRNCTSRLPGEEDGACRTSRSSTAATQLRSA